MMIVTGASGQLGSAVVHALLRRVEGRRIGISVRDPARAADLAASGVRVRHGDFDDPASLRHAFEGATQVLLVSSNARATGGDPIGQHRNAIAAAQEAGVRRILYTSHMAASVVSVHPPAHDHVATEAMLRESGIAWTSLRNGFYASRALHDVSAAVTTGVIEAPVDGKTSWTTHADLAEAAAILLEADGRLDGPTPPLTGSEALDLTDLAAILSDLLGRPIRRTIVPDSEIPARLRARGVPPHIAAMAMGYHQACRAGEFATVDPTLGQLLGRPPVAMRAVLADLVGG